MGAIALLCRVQPSLVKWGAIALQCRVQPSLVKWRLLHYCARISYSINNIRTKLDWPAPRNNTNEQINAIKMRVLNSESAGLVEMIVKRSRQYN